MRNIIDNLYRNEYFVLGLFITIVVLVIIFVIVLFLAIKDAKKVKIDQLKVESSNDDSDSASSAINYDLNTISEDEKPEPIINTAEFAFTSELTPPEEIIVPEVTPLEVKEEEEPVFEEKKEDISSFMDNVINVPEENEISSTDNEETVAFVSPESTDIEEMFSFDTAETYDDSFKEFGLEDKKEVVLEKPVIEEKEPLESIAPILKPIEESPIITPRANVPEQFSSVFVDNPIPKEEIQEEVSTVSFDIDHNKEVELPKRTRPNVMADLPKLAKETNSSLNGPEIEEQVISALDRFETENYDINNY